VTGLRLGPAASWCSGADLLAMPGGILTDAALATEMAAVASELLYVASGRQFTGVTGPVNVRPVSRPIDQDQRFIGWGGYNASWGSCTGGMTAQGPFSHYGCTNPPEVDLGAYPVIGSSLVVVVDGVTIPANEYELQDFRVLKRMLPNASATPTDRSGWPTCQRLTLPSTEPGTFAVTYSYGVTPPVSGVRAAKRLGYELALVELNKPTLLPLRATTVARQGVTIVRADIAQLLAKGQTGIPVIDLFIQNFNPSGAKMPTEVFSPDVGRPRRTLS
jgi:hypothetical protein